MMAPGQQIKESEEDRSRTAVDELDAELLSPLPSPEGRCPEACLSCASPLKDERYPPAGLAHDNHASGRRRGAFYYVVRLLICIGLSRMAANYFSNYFEGRCCPLA